MSTHACAHLHVHSEYSLLDGAANIDGLAARAAAFGQPALGLTDHGVMNGSVELYKACKKHDIKPILGLEAYFVDDRTVREGKIERNHLTLLAASDEGFKNLTKLSSAGFLEGLYRGKPGVDLELPRAPRRGRHRAHRLPRLALAPAGSSRAGSPRRAPTSTTSSRSSAPRTSTSRSSATASPSRSRSTRRSRSSRRRWAARSSPPPTSTTSASEDYHHHAALLCVQTKSTLAAAEDELRHQRVLSEELGGDGGVVQPTCRRRSPPRSRSPSAATSTVALGQQLIPRFDMPGRRVRGGVPARARRRRPAQALRRPDPRRRRRERADMELAVIGNMGFNAYFLIVWDFVALREVQRHRGRPGPWLGRRQHRLLLPARSRTSTRSATTCCSSASSTPSACRCRTSTSTSPSAAASA